MYGLWSRRSSKTRICLATFCSHGTLKTRWLLPFGEHKFFHRLPLPRRYFDLVQMLGQAGRVAEIANGCNCADLIIRWNGKRRPHLLGIKASHGMGMQAEGGRL